MDFKDSSLVVCNSRAIFLQNTCTKYMLPESNCRLTLVKRYVLSISSFTVHRLNLLASRCAFKYNNLCPSEKQDFSNTTFSIKYFLNKYTNI